MPPAILDTVEDPELKANYLAYFKLFQSILGKRPGTPEQKKQVYHRLQKHLVEKVQSVDALIDEIPQMAAALGVPAQTLSSFVAQNFLRALDLARKELEQNSATDSGGSQKAGPADPERDHELIAEILETFGPLVQAPAKFLPADMGAMKLVTPSGEKLPTSIAGAPAEDESPAPSPAASNPAAASAPHSVSKESSPSQPTTVTGKKSILPMEKEEPLIQEILNKFGNHLDVHEKLEPSAFPKNFQKPQEQSASEAKSDAPSAAPTPAAGSGGVKTNEVPKSAGPVIEWPEEDTGLIEELLEQFGNDLAVHGKLEPSDGLSGGSSMASAPSGNKGPSPASHSGSAASSQGESGNRGAEPDLKNARPIPIAPVHFARYTEIRSHLAKFQKAGDQAGYRTYLEQLGEQEKLIVPIRNLENKLQKNPSLKAEDEIYHLAMQLGVAPARLAGFRQAMLRFDKIQLLLNDFVQRVKKGPAPLMKAVQQIWGQVRLLLNQVEQLDSMKSQMKILLLGVQDAELKKRTQEILESMLNRAHNIYTDEG
ncbi:MAG: hypothetical protein KDK23_16290 [Leptospiraceae bacterium]|nr:hypothetical protein [Leptospiraceae bacterium]